MSGNLRSMMNTARMRSSESLQARSMEVKVASASLPVMNVCTLLWTPASRSVLCSRRASLSESSMRKNSCIRVKSYDRQDRVWVGTGELDRQEDLRLVG